MKKIFVKAKPGGKINKVTPPSPKLIPDGEEWYTVEVKEKPVEGRSNEAILKLLSEYFNVPRSSITLMTGAHSKRKVFKIE